MKLLTSIVWRLWRLNCEDIIEVVQQVMHIESIRGYPAKGIGKPVIQKWRGLQAKGEEFVNVECVVPVNAQQWPARRATGHSRNALRSST